MIDGVVLTFTDVTTLKEAEVVLRRGKEELELIIAQRTEELREKARLRRLAHPGQAAADSAYARRKRKLIAEEAQANAG